MDAIDRFLKGVIGSKLDQKGIKRVKAQRVLIEFIFMRCKRDPERFLNGPKLKLFDTISDFLLPTF